MSDLSKGSQLQMSSSLATERPMYDHELARVQRSSLDLQNEHQPPLTSSLVGNDSTSFNEQHDPDGSEHSGLAPSSFSSSEIPVLASKDDYGVYENGVTTNFTDGKNNSYGFRTLNHIPSTSYSASSSVAPHPYPVSNPIPYIQKPMYQGYEQTGAYAYREHPVQATYHSSSFSGWQENSGNHVPPISSESNARTDCAVGADMKTTTSSRMSWTNAQRQDQSYDCVKSEPLPSPPSSFPNSSTGVIQFQSEAPLHQGVFEYINTRERAYQPPPGVSPEVYRSHAYHAHHCPEGSLCAMIPSLPPRLPASRSQNRIPDLRSCPGPSSKRL